jgi:signal transduction histidine kinase
VTVEDTPGGGATFVLRLPMDRTDTSEQPRVLTPR